MNRPAAAGATWNPARPLGEMPRHEAVAFKPEARIVTETASDLETHRGPLVSTVWTPADICIWMLAS